MKERTTLLRNVAMLSIATYAELALGLALGVVIARSLGSSEFGNYAFSVWTCGMLIALSNNALTMSSIKFVAEARGAGQLDVAAALDGQLRRWQAVSSAAVLGAFIVAMWVHPITEWKDSGVLMVSLLVVGAWSRSGYSMLASIGKGNERFEVESASVLLSALVNLFLVTLMSLVGGTLTHFFAIYAVCGLIQNLSARIALRRMRISPQRRPLAPALRRRLRRHLWQSGGLVVVGLLGDRTIEVLLLKAFSTTQDVGFFAIAGGLTKGATYLLAGALSSVLLPAMSRAFGLGGTSSVARILQESMRFYWFIGVAIAGLGAAFAPGAVRLLYGQQYEGAITSVTVNLMVSGFVLVAAAFNAFQTSSDRQGDRIRIALMALGVNIVAALILVPKFGLNGALGSFAITKFASVCFSWAFARRVEHVVMPVSPMVRILIAAMVATALAEGFDLLVPGRFAFLGAGATFVIAYGLASVVLRAWAAADYELVAEAVGQLGRPGRSLANLINAGRRYASPAPGPSGFSKREIASSAVSALGLTTVIGTLRSAVVNDLRVLAYHRVLPQLDEASFRFDTELVSATQAEFDWQIAYVARRFRPVSCQQVATAIRSGTPLPKRAVMVTFDDGFRDNHDVAFPILQRHGIPAVFFLTTGYIDTPQILWFDWLVHVVLRSPASSIRLDALNLTIRLGNTNAERRAEAFKLLRLLKATPEIMRLLALAQLREAAGVQTTAADHDLSAPMTWDQVRAMSRGGMEFGSHTVSHPILSTISDPELLRFELEGSKTTIEREIGRPVIALAYPVGGRDAVGTKVIAEVKRSGYEFAFTYEPGANALPLDSPFLLKRLQIERYTTRSMFAASLELPGIFAR